MQLTLTKRDPCWVELGAPTGAFIAVVKASVRPYTYRKWDPDTQTWLVHWHWLEVLVGLARQHYVDVDYSALPTKWQLRAAGAHVASSGLSAVTGSDPFAVLHVTEDAPQEVVKAAYKALAALYHPDAAGGNAERFRQVREAYQLIAETEVVTKAAVSG